MRQADRKRDLRQPRRSHQGKKNPNSTWNLLSAWQKQFSFKSKFLARFLVENREKNTFTTQKISLSRDGSGRGFGEEAVQKVCTEREEQTVLLPHGHSQAAFNKTNPSASTILGAKATSNMRTSRVGRVGRHASKCQCCLTLIIEVLKVPSPALNLPLSQVAPGDTCRLEDRKDEPWQSRGDRDKRQFFCRASPLWSGVTVSKAKKQTQLHAVAYPLHTPAHTLSGYHPVKGEQRHSHNRRFN